MLGVLLYTGYIPRRYRGNKGKQLLLELLIVVVIVATVKKEDATVDCLDLAYQ